METEIYNILYVDDEPSNLNSFKLLYRRKFNILTAESGGEGLKILENQPIDLIITDQRMPEMTGVEFLKKVKNKWPTLKCILLTGFTDNEAIKEAINVVGIYWYINKPFDTNQMEHLIKKAIEVSHIETEKKVSDEMLHMFLDTAMDAIITIDNEQLITMINPAVITMFGYDKEELLGQKIEILIPDSIINHSQLIKDFGSSHNTSVVMMPNKTIYGKTKSGKLIPIETTLSKMEVAGEIFYSAIIRDVSERIKAEKQLKESEEKFRSVFEGSHSGIPLVNLQRQFISSNERFREMFGYSEEELKNMTIADFTLPEDQEESFNKTNALISSEITHYEEEKKYIKKNGELLDCHTSVTAPHGADGKPMFMPAMNGITLCKKIKENHENTKVVAFTMRCDKSAVKQVFDAGASGFLLKSCGLKEIQSAIDVISNGEKYISNGLQAG